MITRRWTPVTLTLAAMVYAPATVTAQSVALADTLDFEEAVQAALEIDPRISAASARAEQAGAAVGATRAERLPFVATSGLVSRYDKPMVVAPLHALEASQLHFDQTLIQGRVLVTHTLYDGGATGSRIAAARSLEAAAEAGLEDARSTVLEDVADAYLGVLTAREVLAAARQRVLDLEAELDRASQLFDEGVAPRLTLLRAEAELAGARASSEGAAARVLLAESALARRIGASAETVAGSALQDLPLPAAPSPSRAVSEPSALVAAREQAAAAAARVREALAARHPQVSAGAGVEEFGGASSPFSTEWHGGFEIEYAIFTGGGRKHAVELARAEQREADALVADVRRSFDDAADAARAAQTEALARASALADAVTSLEELERVEQLALDEGAGVQRDFLEATADLAETRAALAEARRAAVLAEVRLARATGRLTPEWILTLTEAGR